MKLDKFRRRISKKSVAFDWIPQNTTENIVEKSRNKIEDSLSKKEYSDPFKGSK